MTANNQDQVKQMIAQCKVVAHLAQAIADAHLRKAELFEAAPQLAAGLTSILGPETASLMETFGDILNDMDAVAEEHAAWVDPIFAEAHRLWPR